MQPRDEEIVSLWQAYRDQSGVAIANAHLSVFMQPPEYTALMSEIEELVSERDLRTCVMPTSFSRLPPQYLEAF
ncbi:hypothetical protein JQ628_11490 [Bradyrhizobium lablabi]|uniref:hypothetical protein n=1 Tax=Bradyrhizobium lablabi TaxID=722472 RepID=UPI001BAD53CC|nr:hypothetical protein [Bradyrhizobium lablabi]MBR1122139.1 hypothetical protein [Bradyrhizobium lablabi]